MGYLKIKNWEEYQHYKDRNPPWIKLHVQTLNDREFMALSLASRGLLMQLWILASEKEGKVTDDLEDIKFRLRDRSIKEKDVNLLIKKGFLIPCKQVLADASKCSPEAEAEAEADSRLTPTCPQQKIVDLFHSTIPELPRVKQWDETRQSHLRARWKEDPKRQNLEWWEGFFNYIKNKCPFLMGKVDPIGNRKRFFANLPWIVERKNFLKIIEGNYEGGR